METTKNLKLTYHLSAAGQKLAVLAGRPAQSGISTFLNSPRGEHVFDAW